MVKKKILKVPEDIFVSPKDEEEYFRINKVEKKVLDNGITIIGISREVNDAYRAKIEFEFPTGSFNDPADKAGLHHLTEHFFNKTIREKANYYDVDLNAYTSCSQLGATCRGLANPKAKDFGIWPILPKIPARLANPLEAITNVDKIVDREKEVVMAEITEDYSKHNWLSRRFLDEVIFAPGNPILSYPAGTKDGLANITTNDVRSFINEKLIPDQLLISLYGEVDEGTTEVLVDRLEKYFVDFPRSDKKATPVDWLAMDKLNSQFKPGEIYRKSTGLKNGLITIKLVWILEREIYTPLSLSLNRVVHSVSDDLFILARRKGWSYSSEAYLTIPGLTSGAFVVRLDIPKLPAAELQNFVKKFISDVKSEILKPQKIIIEKLLSQEKKRQKASPILIADRLWWITFGLRRWGRPIDADRIKGRYREMKYEDIKTWMEKFLNIDPAVILVGDLD